MADLNSDSWLGREPEQLIQIPVADETALKSFPS